MNIKIWYSGYQLSQCITGALIYRGFRFEKKKKLKILHMVILLGAFILAIIGLVAVFDFHNNVKNPIPNMYSLHSWIGLSTIILFACQVSCLGT